MKNKICASLMCADLMNLEDELQALEKAGVDYIHWDIMDGSYVPNFSLNQDFMKAARDLTDMKFDTHLMITEPGRFVQEFAGAGTDILVVHAEACRHLHRVLQQINDLGVKAGVALNPATPVEEIKYVLPEIEMVLVMTVNPGFAGQKMIPATLNKITKIREISEKQGLELDIQVDGNVSFVNAPKMKKCGANVFVAGTSSIFSENISKAEGTAKLRKAVDI